MLTNIKQRVERAFSPLGDAIAATGLKPNHITVLGFALNASSVALLAWTGSLPSFLAVFTLASLMDVLDGYVARKTGRVSAFGAFLDSTLDRVSDTLTSFALMLVGVASAYETIFLVLGEYLVSYTRARAESLGVKMAGIGIAERAERLLLKFSVFFAILIGASIVARAVLWVLILVTYITVLQRVAHAYRSLTRTTRRER